MQCRFIPVAISFHKCFFAHIMTLLVTPITACNAFEVRFHPAQPIWPPGQDYNDIFPRQQKKKHTHTMITSYDEVLHLSCRHEKQTFH